MHLVGRVQHQSGVAELLCASARRVDPSASSQDISFVFWKGNSLQLCGWQDCGLLKEVLVRLQANQHRCVLFGDKSQKKDFSFDHFVFVRWGFFFVIFRSSTVLLSRVVYVKARTSFYKWVKMFVNAKSGLKSFETYFGSFPRAVKVNYWKTLFNILLLTEIWLKVLLACCCFNIFLKKTRQLVATNLGPGLPKMLDWKFNISLFLFPTLSRSCQSDCGVCWCFMRSVNEKQGSFWDLLLTVVSLQLCISVSEWNLMGERGRWRWGLGGGVCDKSSR